MKPEPLKNKLCYAEKIVMKDTEGITYDLNGDIPFLIPDRVKAAVEWLKSKVTIEQYKKSGKTNWLVYIDNQIDKAFEDIK